MVHTSQVLVNLSSWLQEKFDTHQTRITLDDWQPAQTDNNEENNHHTTNNDSFPLVGLKQGEWSCAL